MQGGSLVECIHQLYSDEYQPCPFEFPIVGEIYKVRDIVTYNGSVGLRLEEIICPTGKKGEMCWHIGAFKEIQPPMTISIDELIEEPQMA